VTRSARRTSQVFIASLPSSAMADELDVERILVIAAHPDDVDYGAAGSVATWTDAGIDVSYCIVTDGDAGGFDPDVGRHEIAGIRQQEQVAAAKEVGVTDVTFLGHPDGYLEVSLALRKDIARVIRTVRPQRVVTQSPERRYETVYASHPDHLVAGEATMCAVYPDSRNQFWFPELVEVEGLEPWTVDEVYLMGGPDADVYIDITEQLDRKVAALLRHDSQMTDPGGLETRIRGWGESTAGAGGLESGRCAESFRRVPTA